jgi:hypothetical protein
MKFTFNPCRWCIGFSWRVKPPAVWVNIPMCEWYIPIGKDCSYCHGQGGFFIEAGGGDWYDECEVCKGTGRKK